MQPCAPLPSVPTTLNCNSIPNESRARDAGQPNGKSLSIRKVICDSLSELQQEKGGGLDTPIDIDNLRVAVNQSLTNRGLQDFAALHFPGKSSLCHFCTGLLVCISNFDFKSRKLVVFCKLNPYSFVNIAYNKFTKIDSYESSCNSTLMSSLERDPEVFDLGRGHSAVCFKSPSDSAA